MCFTRVGEGATHRWLCAAVCPSQNHLPVPMEHSWHSHSIQGEGHQVVARNQNNEAP